MQVSASLTNACGPVFTIRSPEHVTWGGPYDTVKCVVVAPFDAPPDDAPTSAAATTTSATPSIRRISVPSSSRLP